MKAENHLKIDQQFQFQPSAAQTALANWQLSSEEAYQARLALLKVSILAASIFTKSDTGGEIFLNE